MELKLNDAVLNQAGHVGFVRRISTNGVSFNVIFPSLDYENYNVNREGLYIGEETNSFYIRHISAVLGTVDFNVCSIGVRTSSLTAGVRIPILSYTDAKEGSDPQVMYAFGDENIYGISKFSFKSIGEYVRGNQPLTNFARRTVAKVAMGLEQYRKWSLAQSLNTKKA